MSEIKDGGQAFPWRDEFVGGHLGMTLRDYFAAQAMLALVHAASSHLVPAGEMLDALDISNLCIGAYGFADAMLKAREQK